MKSGVTTTATGSGFWGALWATKLEILNAILLCGVFIVTAWLSQATLNPFSSDAAHTSAWNPLSWLGLSDTLAILHLLQNLLSTISLMLLFQSFDTISWIYMGKESGIRTLRLLGISSTTGLTGTLSLLIDRHVTIVDRLVIAGKLLLLVTTWLSGVVLFMKTDIVVINKTSSIYNVTAGVGMFRGSYVSKFLQQLQETNAGLTTLPYSIITTASQLTLNSRHSITTSSVTCTSPKDCNAYLLPGGLMSSTPWPPVDHEDHPLITIHDAPASQLDFERIWPSDETQLFNDAQDCRVFGSDGFRVGMKFCLAQNQSEPDSLLAGLFVCPQGVLNGTCLPSSSNASLPKLLTSLKSYQRHASVTCARSNMSIASIDSLTPPIQIVDLPASDLLHAFSWLFNSTASGIPAPSSVAQYFWSVQSQLSSEYWSMEAYQLFLSLLSFPFWHFNDNNFGNVRLKAQDIVQGLPEEFYTWASVDKPLQRIVVDRGMFIVFCILQVITIAFIWITLIRYWIDHASLPTVSSYPIMDFALKTEQVTASKLTGTLSRQDSRAIDPASNSSVIIKAMQHERTMIRRGPTIMSPLVHTQTDDPKQPLVSGVSSPTQHDAVAPRRWNRDSSSKLGYIALQTRT